MEGALTFASVTYATVTYENVTTRVRGRSQLSRPMREPSGSHRISSVAQLKVEGWGGKVGVPGAGCRVPGLDAGCRMPDAGSARILPSVVAGHEATDLGAVGAAAGHLGDDLAAVDDGDPVREREDLVELG